MRLHISSSQDAARLLREQTLQGRETANGSVQLHGSLRIASNQIPYNHLRIFDDNIHEWCAKKIGAGVPGSLLQISRWMVRSVLSSYGNRQSYMIDMLMMID